MTYRPDIEGLRALAILLVVAAHAGVPGMQAGFVGVDVFFVISGYLITGLLVTEHARTGRIGIAAFYARRFRRLLPALLLMLLVTALAVRLLLSPEERAFQGAAGAAASFWASNLYFAFERIDYFGLASESNVYLHTWSLGLEEQFYLVWPLLLVGLLPRGASMQGRRLALGMGVILVISVIACIWVTQVSSRQTFYLMPFRAWQFAAGALAWLLATKQGGLNQRGDALATAIGAAGLLLIVLSLVLIGRQAKYPGAWALLPTLGAVGVLLAATTGRNLVTRALALPPLQTLGKVSYGWYLWHWPVLVIGAVLLVAPNLAQRLMLVACALLVAVLSYRWLERPLRTNDALVRRPRRWILVALALMLGAALVFVRWMDVADAWAQDASGPVTVAAPGMPVIYPMGCDDSYLSDQLLPCVFGDAAAPRTVVVIGDSIGLQWFPAYADIFSSPQWRLVVLTKSSCPMVDRPIFNARIGREFTECASWRDKALGYVESLRPDVVVMGTTHTADFDEAAWVDGTGDVLARLAPATGRVFIMRSTPLLPFNGAQCVHRRNPVDAAAWHQAATACSAPVADQKNDEVYGWLKKASDRWGNVDVVDMNGDACPGGICSAVHGLELAYRDNQHLDARFVKQLSAALREKMGEAAVGDGREREAGSEGP